MELISLKPKRGEGALRIDDSDDFVVIENAGPPPSNGQLTESGVYAENHGVIIICMKGMAQFEYEGQTIQLHKNDMFIYYVGSVISNFMSSPNFNCRQIWFVASEAWNIDMHGTKSLGDHLMFLRRHPLMRLSDQDAAMFDGYFQLLCRRMRDRAPMLYIDIVRSLFGTILLEVLDRMQRNMIEEDELYKLGGGRCHARCPSSETGRQVYAIGGAEWRSYPQGGLFRQPVEHHPQISLDADEGDDEPLSE